MTGYKTITPIQFANVLSARNCGAIDQHGLRVYFACFVLVAVREAAKRYRKAKGETPKELARYRINELEQLTQLTPRAIKRALRRLDAAGLLHYSEAEIIIAKAPLEGATELLEVLSCRRSPKRPIPVPRSILRFIAESRKETLTKTVIGYLVRGLSLSKKGGVVSNRGTVKASWIGETLDLSERSVKYARDSLVRMGWFERDTQSLQRKLNRDGAYFVIDLEWAFTPDRGQPAAPNQNPGPTLVNRNNSATNFAPRSVRNCPIFAPPNENKKSSIEDKNQKARPSEPPGVLNREEKNPPTLRNIVPEDLWSFGRLEVIYVQGVKTGIIKGSEAMALNFIAAAVRAREAGRSPVRLFAAIVRQGLWHHITQGQEDQARRAMVKYRAENPTRFLARCAGESENDAVRGRAEHPSVAGYNVDRQLRTRSRGLTQGSPVGELMPRGGNSVEGDDRPGAAGSPVGEPRASSLSCCNNSGGTVIPKRVSVVATSSSVIPISG